VYFYKGEGKIVFRGGFASSYTLLPNRKESQREAKPLFLFPPPSPLKERGISPSWKGKGGEVAK